MFKNILVPTDGSALSQKAIELGVRLAKEQKARVTGFWVGPEWQAGSRTDSSLTGFVSPDRHSAAVKEEAERVLELVRKTAAAAGVPCKCIHVTGTFPYEEILKTAQRNRCDLIVMASHGRRGISRVLLGSETNKVLAHAKMPVLVCR
jgi:nucleotide-binding universal stress UspA family protein